MCCAMVVLCGGRKCYRISFAYIQWKVCSWIMLTERSISRINETISKQIEFRLSSRRLAPAGMGAESFGSNNHLYQGSVHRSRQLLRQRRGTLRSLSSVLKVSTKRFELFRRLLLLAGIGAESCGINNRLCQRVVHRSRQLLRQCRGTTQGEAASFKANCFRCSRRAKGSKDLRCRSCAELRLAVLGVSVLKSFRFIEMLKETCHN